MSGQFPQWMTQKTRDMATRETAARQAADAERVEAWQWRGWSEQATAHDPMVIAESDEKAAYLLGHSGIRPDADALAAARAKGYAAGVAEGREQVLAVVRWLEEKGRIRYAMSEIRAVLRDLAAGREE
jgi:hypothetical protein